MLTKEDITSIIHSGEGYNADFKVRVPNKLKELSEEICAFANAAGGVLLLGVSDDNQVVGVEIDNAKRSAIQNSLDEINPHLHTEIYKVAIDEKSVWVIEVNSGNQKPYALSGAIYVRQGPNSQKLTSVEQMRDFFQQAERIFFEEVPCPNFDINKDIDNEWFEEFRLKSGFSDVVSNVQIIRNLKLLNAEEQVKNGAVLFLGRHPEEFIETAVLRCTEFEGVNKTQIIDDKIWKGPLYKQYEQAMYWLRKKLNIRYEISGGGPRKEIWEIPETALKEAIINALAHRDYYDKGARINIELYTDRIEINNPGGLSNAVPLSEFGSKSYSRNPLIFGLFQRIDMVEQVGSGIGRMKDEMLAAGLPYPKFKTDGIFTVVFQREKKKLNVVEETVEEAVEETVEETVEVIINEMLANPKITAKELQEKTGLTRRGVEYHIDKLKKEKRIKRIGSTKAGSWKVLY
jgi:ATP-dependent DNA helicase RecG